MAEITKAQVKMEGQEPMVVPVPEASDDAKLRTLLAPYVENIRNASFKRETKDRVMTIEIVKKGYALGALGDVLATLEASYDGLNPVVALALELRSCHPGTADVMALQPRIEAVLAEGERQHGEMDAMLRALDQTEPDVAATVPLGF